MRKTVIYILAGIAFISCNAPKNAGPEIDLSSVDAFFVIAGQVRQGHHPSDAEWEELFATRGYAAYHETDEAKRALKDMTLFAFDPAMTARRDSMLALPREEIYANMYNYTGRMTLENFLDMQDHWDRLIEFRDTYDFSPVYTKAVDKLAAFLGEPRDSLSGIASVSFLCYEFDAHSRKENITMDFNMFYKLPEEESVGYIAHELFHSFRSRIQGEAYRERLFSEPFLFAIDRAADEGIADLIDKPEEVPAYFREKGTSQALIETYEAAYPATPELLARLDSLTVQLVEARMDEGDFQKALTGYFKVGGHPNGLYMARVIRLAGMLEELINSSTSPFAFFRIYHRAAAVTGEYTFSKTFLGYLDRREAEMPAMALR